MTDTLELPKEPNGSPVCVLCASPGSGKLWLDTGDFRGVAHDDCAVAYRGYRFGDIDAMQAKRKAGAQRWKQIAGRMRAGEI